MYIGLLYSIFQYSIYDFLLQSKEKPTIQPNDLAPQAL